MNRLLPHWLIILLLAATFSACKGTRTVTMNSMRPAEITFPSYVNSLVVVDRTKFNKSSVNIVEGILTGELPGEDAVGVQELVNAFQQQLGRSPRFQARVATEKLSGNSLTSVFPQPLSWRKINSLCKKYDAQAIVAIEIFDTDFIVTNGRRKVKKTVVVDSVKKEIEVNEFYAEGLGNLTIGIRLYDPKAKTIVDQQLLRENRRWNAKASTLRDALSQLIAKGEATRFLSQRVGGDYAHKIAPMPIRISRMFYSKAKKSPAVAQGSRYADVGQWKQAANVWEQGIGFAPTKQAGYLAYNVAIAHEVLGDLEKAKEWAQQAYVRFGNKEARSYASLIQRRLYDEEVLREQLSENLAD